MGAALGSTASDAKTSVLPSPQSSSREAAAPIGVPTVRGNRGLTRLRIRPFGHFRQIGHRHSTERRPVACLGVVFVLAAVLQRRIASAIARTTMRPFDTPGLRKTLKRGVFGKLQGDVTNCILQLTVADAFLGGTLRRACARKRRFRATSVVRWRCNLLTELRSARSWGSRPNVAHFHASVGWARRLATSGGRIGATSV